MSEEQQKSPIDLALEKFRAAQMDFNDLQKVPEPEWLIEPILPKDAVTVLWSEPGAWKSFLALDWSMSLATATSWFGKKTVQTNVLYILGEGASGMRQRANAWVAEHGIYPDGEIVWISKMVNMFEELEVAAIKQLAAEHSAGLIVIDTLARAMAGHSENDSMEMGKLVAAAEELRDDLKATVLLVHHANTSADKKMRGSSALKGAIDTEFQIDVDDPLNPMSQRSLKCRKQKDAAPFDPILIDAVQVENSLVLVNHWYSGKMGFPNEDVLYG